MQSNNIIFRYKLILLIIFLVILVCLELPAYSGGLFYGFQLPELGLANSTLFCHNSGFFTYTLSPGFQRMGWFLLGLISSIDPAENVYGSITGGVLLILSVRLDADRAISQPAGIRQPAAIYTFPAVCLLFPGSWIETDLAQRGLIYRADAN